MSKTDSISKPTKEDVVRAKKQTSDVTEKKKENALAIMEKLESVRKIEGRFFDPKKKNDTESSEEISFEKIRERKPFQRDYARILYSSAFRRLQGKMQMLGIDSSSFYRNRLTHSLEVSHVARGICYNLKKEYRDALKSLKETNCLEKFTEETFWTGDEFYLIEAISLAHDLGNPPFGHAGEAVLNDLAADFGGFEGNAQTFRIVTKIEKKYADVDGLNLSKRTLLGLAKHLYPQSSGEDKFLYDEDYCIVKKILSDVALSLKDGEKSIDCAVMDLADEIAYAAHDLEDELQQKYINADGLIYLFEKEKRSPNLLEKFKSDEITTATEKIKKLVDSARAYAMKVDRGDSDDMFDTIFRKELSSEIVDTLITDVDYIEKDKNLGFSKFGALCAGLKKLLFNAIKNDSEMILLYERKGRKVIEGLFKVYSDKSFNDKNALLTTPYRLCNTPAERKRAVIDYIAGMMDTFAIEQYEKFYGRGSLDGMYRNFDSTI